MALTSQANSQEQELDRERFLTLWRRCAQIDCGNGHEVFERLLRHYKEAHRRYHSPEHIRHCLRQFDLAREYMNHPDAIEVALWFHDVIYEPGAADNEARSAELFLRFAQHCMADDFCRKVVTLIMATVHPSQPQTLDEKFIVDIDLSSFALPRRQFDRDSLAVRQEKPELSDQKFYTGQTRFMQSLLARPHFFATDFFRRKYETKARTNLKRYLDEIQTMGSPK